MTFIRGKPIAPGSITVGIGFRRRCGSESTCGISVGLFARSVAVVIISENVAFIQIGIVFSDKLTEIVVLIPCNRIVVIGYSRDVAV